jgi:voltage-gated potassium channel
MRTRLRRASPSFRRFFWYARQIGSAVDRRFFIALIPTVLVLDLIGAVIVTVIEKEKNLASLVASFNWALLTTMGRSPSGFVESPVGWLVFWVLVIFGVTLVGTITAALVAVVVNFLLKEGQGMGVSGFRDHVVVCGWNATARDLIRELRRDDRKVRIVLIHSGDRNPAGEGVYYVKGDPADAGDLRRAGIEDAAAAVVFPLESSGDADMKSILVSLTIRSMAPQVRVVAEVNDARHVDHFKRAGADELMVTSHIASRLLARSAIYPGLTDLVADLVSSGGSELYGVKIPPDLVGLSFEAASNRFRAEHQATLLAIRRNGHVTFNAPREFTLRKDDVAVVIADHLGRLDPAPREERAATGGTLQPTLAPREPRVVAPEIEASRTPQGH